MTKFVLLGLWLLIYLPPLGSWLKSTMLLHMLMQLTAFVLIGITLAKVLVKTYPQTIIVAQKSRFALLLTGILTMMTWMIPRLLDLAIEQTLVDLIKAISLTLFVGVPLYLAWLSLGPVVRGLLHVEALATLLRLGWVYVDSPNRLCSQYGLNDQSRVGNCLLLLGCIYAAWLALKILIGHPREADPFTS
jgi:hypothetical protein